MSPAELILLVKSTAKLYWSCLKKAGKLYIKNYLFLIVTLLLLLFIDYGLGYIPFYSAGRAGGFISSAIHSFFLSLYYFWLSKVVLTGKLVKKEIFQFSSELFYAIIGINFSLWILQMITANIPDLTVLLSVAFGVYLVFAAVPEAIYISRGNSMEATTKSIQFTLSNWIEWLFPPILITLIFVGIGFITLENHVEALLYFLRPVLKPWELITFVSMFFKHIAYYYVLAVLAQYYMIFRGLLYIELDGSNRRKRLFQAKFS